MDMLRIRRHAYGESVLLALGVFLLCVIPACSAPPMRATCEEKGGVWVEYYRDEQRYTNSKKVDIRYKCSMPDKAKGE